MTNRALWRNFEGGHYVDLFLVSSICAVLGIRFSLKLTDYPQVAPGGLHVSHVLWGGLLMLASLLILLSYLGRGGHQLAAVVGGVGFGTFIDEVGKFLTSDNNYFFKPAAAVIYLTFVLVYIAVRSIHREQLASQPEYLANAADLLKRLAGGGLSQEERDRAFQYLSRCESNAAVSALTGLLKEIETTPQPPPGRLARTRRSAAATIRRIAMVPGFNTAMVTFFAVQFTIKMAHAILIMFADNVGPQELVSLSFAGLRDGSEVESRAADWAQLVSSLLAAGFVAAGFLRIGRSRLDAYRMFQRSVLVTIFLTQVFMFYREEWRALLGLAFNILVFLALRFTIEVERIRTWNGLGAPPQPDRGSTGGRFKNVRLPAEN